MSKTVFRVLLLVMLDKFYNPLEGLRSLGTFPKPPKIRGGFVYLVLKPGLSQASSLEQERRAGKFKPRCSSPFDSRRPVIQSVPVVILFTCVNACDFS
ncbi:uncharacterized [Tachysurus ichikawai]